MCGGSGLALLAPVPHGCCALRESCSRTGLICGPYRIVLSRMAKGPQSARGFPVLGCWRSLIAGLTTFLLSGLLGFVLIYRSPYDVGCLSEPVPAFVGLLQCRGDPNLLRRVDYLHSTSPAPRCVMASVDAGSRRRGRSLAAFLPIVTGDGGSWLATDRTRDERVFLVLRDSWVVCGWL